MSKRKNFIGAVRGMFFSILILAFLLALAFLATGCSDDAEGAVDRILLRSDSDEDESTDRLVEGLSGIEGTIRDQTEEIDQEGGDIAAAISTSTHNSSTNSGVVPNPGPVNSTGSSGGAGFVWKPISEGDGNLVVLLPSYSSSTRVDVNGELGDYVGRTNGDRPTFRFDSPGCAYGEGAVVSSEDGITETIPNGCDRYEG